MGEVSISEAILTKSMMVEAWRYSGEFRRSCAADWLWRARSAGAIWRSSSLS
jgi:hypothetical protein